MFEKIIVLIGIGLLSMHVIQNQTVKQVVAWGIVIIGALWISGVLDKILG